MASVGQEPAPGFPSGTLLGSLPEATVARLSARWRVFPVGKGGLVIGSEETSDDFFLVLHGAARAAVYTANGRELIFVDVGRGDCFGELAAIDGAPRSANVVALEPLSVARLSSREFHALLREDEAFCTAMLQLLSGKLRRLTRQLTEYAALTGPQRICGELLAMAKRHRTGPDAAQVPHPVTQAELSRIVFTNRETVTREVARLKGKNLLSWSRSAIQVPSIARLEREYAALLGE
ncbi:MAG: Crp/Fnr family transcriptional regulator [Pseudomonadota bacterium]|nr:Crp/Fnr family transcriptional regulator [Pseudomonadota bacterium]